MSALTESSDAPRYTSLRELSLGISISAPTAFSALLTVSNNLYLLATVSPRPSVTSLIVYVAAAASTASISPCNCSSVSCAVNVVLSPPVLNLSLELFTSTYCASTLPAVAAILPSVSETETIAFPASLISVTSRSPIAFVICC